MFTKIKQIAYSSIFKQSALYTIGAMAPPLVNIILLPVYTNYLTSTEYAIMTTIQALVGMLQIFLILSLKGAVTRFYFDNLEDRIRQRKVTGTLFTFVLIFSSIISAILIMLQQPIGELLFNNIPIQPYFSFFVCLSLVNALMSLPLALYRAREKAGMFVFINFFKAFSVMGLTCYLIIIQNLGAAGALISQIIITTIIVVFTWISEKKYYEWNLNIEVLKKSLSFSLPLIPHAASGWIIMSSDRIILENFVSLNNLGSYALAAQVASVLTIFYQSLNNALAPRYIILMKKNQSEKAKKLMRSFAIVIIATGILSIPIAMGGVKLIAAESFHGALVFIPYLLLGQIFKGIYHIPVANLFYTKKTKAIATSSSLAALVNLVVNFMLIPFIGVPGAIISTILAEFARLYLIGKANKMTK